MVNAQARTVGRAARGVMAAAALVTIALTALLMLTWSCCSRPTFGERLGGLWGVVPAGLVALAAFPPVTRRVRTHGLRWWLAPLVVVDLWLCGWLCWTAVNELGQGPANTREALYFFVPLVVPNLICAVYVAWRVVLKPPIDDSNGSNE